MNETVKEYMSKPYNVVIEPVNDEAGFYYMAKVSEFDGCIVTGETQQEARTAVYEVLEGFIESMLENGEEVPEPKV